MSDDTAMMTIIRLGLLGWLLAASCLLVPMQQSQTDASSTIEDWFNGPDRRAIPWQVKVSQPMLTYQQRHLVEVLATVDGSEFGSRAGHKFIFEVRVGDMNGNWFPGEDRSEFEVPLNPPRPIRWAYLRTGVYALPGDYRVGVVMYDRTNGVGNIRHSNFHVPAVKGNLLPELTRGLPPIEFPTRIPGMNQDLRGERDPGWSLAKGVEHLPVSDARSLRIDIVLDFSELDAIDLPIYMRAETKGAITQSIYFRNLRDTLQMGSVLSHLQPLHGCVHVSAIDMSRMHVLLDGQDAPSLDWSKFEKGLYSFDPDRIDVATMTKQHDRSAFAAKFLVRMANDSGGCGAGTEPADHVVVLVSHHLQYPPHTPLTPIQPEECPNCRFVYLRLTPYELEPVEPYRDILKLMHPRSFRFSTPEGFRDVLRKLTAELSGSPNS